MSAAKTRSRARSTAKAARAGVRKPSAATKAARPAKRTPLDRAANGPARLAELQRWMQHEVVREVERKPALAPADRHLLPSRTLTPAERVNIYTTMYRLRMGDALEVDYPALLQHLGRERFDALMTAYLRRHPSRHYSLNFLGYAVPEFLAREAKVRERAFLADVARVEHAITEVFDAEPSTTLDRAALAALPPAAFARLRLEFVPAFRLLALEHDANKAVTALRHGKSAPSTKKHRAWVAVYRKEHVVWRLDLDEPAYRVLDSLQRGRTLPQAIAAGAKAFRGGPEELQTAVQGWFAEWSAEGFFRALRS
ncbi:MAG: DNA-binding domain-containing protein [Planctomycetota bacterium]